MDLTTRVPEPLLKEFHQNVELERILSPAAFDRRRQHFDPSATDNPASRFVHYTSAEAALRIIKSKRIWMRNTNCMNDFSEVRHGFRLLYSYFSVGSKRSAFMEAIDKCHKDVAKQAIGDFDGWWNRIQVNTFITSISEHSSSEDEHGRLSMWRAFGGSIARVAIVLKIPWFSDQGQGLNLRVSPVLYSTAEQVSADLDRTVENIQSSVEFLKSVAPEAVKNSVFSSILSRVVCLKHPGFHEEKEWRVIYSPDLWPSKLIEPTVEVISGIPQVVHNIPVDGSRAPHDFDLKNLFDRLIIGPSPYPWPLYEAFAVALKDAGIPEAKICASDIPIRN